MFHLNDPIKNNTQTVDFVHSYTFVHKTSCMFPVEFCYQNFQKQQICLNYFFISIIMLSPTQETWFMLTSIPTYFPQCQQSPPLELMAMNFLNLNKQKKYFVACCYSPPLTSTENGYKAPPITVIFLCSSVVVHVFICHIYSSLFNLLPLS